MGFWVRCQELGPYIGRPKKELDGTSMEKMGRGRKEKREEKVGKGESWGVAEGNAGRCAWGKAA